MYADVRARNTDGLPAYLLESSLDGVPLAQCVAACEECGWALVHVLDDEGRSMLNAARDEMVKRVVHGTIRLRLPESAPLTACYAYIARRQQGHQCPGIPILKEETCQTM